MYLIRKVFETQQEYIFFVSDSFQSETEVIDAKMKSWSGTGSPGKITTLEQKIISG